MASRKKPTKIKKRARPTKRKLQKKGLQLATNFFVMLIIIVVIFSGSVYFINKFYKETKQIEETISRDTESQIEGLLRGGNVVAIPLNKKEMRRGQSATYWLGILNILGEDKQDFGVYVKFAKAFDDTETEIKEADPEFIDSKWTLVSEGPHEIKNNEFKSVGIKINANNNMADGIATAKGTYVFNVCVFNGQLDPDFCANPRAPFPDSVYTGKVYKLYVEVI